MKKNVRMTWLLTVCLILGTISLTSCLGSNEDNQVKTTKEEVQLALAKMKDKRTSKLIYPQCEMRSTADRTGTLDISWALTIDSMMVIHNFPAKALAENVTNTDSRKLLLTTPDQNLKCNIGFYGVSPIAFVIQPTRLTYQLDDDGVSRKCRMALYHNIPGSTDVYNEEEGQANMIMQIVQAAILEQGREKEVFRRGILSISSEKGKK